MKKRVLSLFMALALCLTLLPTAVLAEMADDTVRKYRDDTGTNANDSYVLGGDTTVQDVEESDEAVKTTQALIDALPDEVTADNIETLQAQLIAIGEALKVLSEEQIAKLDMTRYEALCASMTNLTAVQEDAEHLGNHGFTKPEDEKWQGVSSLTKDMTAGYYYLTGPVTLTETWQPADGVVLCLNGMSVTANGAFDAIRISSSSTFTLCNCAGDGSITHGTNDSSQKYTGRGVYVASGATFIMYSGAISGNTNTDYRANGGGVYVDADSADTFGTFHMYGGTISDNEVVGQYSAGGGGVSVDWYAHFYLHDGTITRNKVTKSNNSAYGGGVYVQSNAYFTMENGTISGNELTGASDAPYTTNSGGGVFADSGSIVTLSGGKITGNKVDTAGKEKASGAGMQTYNSTVNLSGGIEITGNVTKEDVKNNVYLNEGTLNVVGDLSGTIGVTTENLPTAGNPKKIAAAGRLSDGASETTALTADDINHFTPDAGDGYQVVYDEAKKALYLEFETHEHPICGKTGCTEHGDVLTDWVGVGSLTNNMGAGHYYLTTNVTLDATWEPEDGTVLDLNGHSITMNEEGSVINVTGSFTLTDCKGGNDANHYGTITHKEEVGGSGVDVRPTTGGVATFTMYGGEISGNQALSSTSGVTHGGGVRVNDYRSTFKMLGGIITNNKAPNGGGGVYIGGGKFELSGNALISENTAKNGSGGGVYLNGSSSSGSLNEFTMSGNAIIAENTATNGSGGGVYMNGGPTFTMNGGSIYKNTATNDGGGVYATGTFTMKGGTIGSEDSTKGNSAKYGGGVHLQGANGTFTMTNDASVINNTATNDGGGVYVQQGTVTMSGESSIRKNTANNNGGGVLLNSTLEMSGNAEIAENKSRNNGAGVCVGGSSAQFTMDGGSIHGNEYASDGGVCYGGGVYIGYGTFTMNGGSIYKNTASHDGGGVYVKATFNMNSGNIYNNTATQNGGGVYINTGTFTMTNGTIGGSGADDGNMALNGGGVYVSSGSSTHFKIFGGIHVANNGGVKDNTDDVYLEGGQSIEIIGELFGDKMVGVALENPPANMGGHVTFATGAGNYQLTDADRNVFISNQYVGANERYNIARSGNDLWVVNGTLHQHKVCVGTDETDCTHGEENFDVLTYDELNNQLVYGAFRSNNQINGNLSLYLKNDIEISETITITATSNVTLCLNGHSIISKTVDSDVIKIENGATLTLCDCRGDSTDNKFGKITHHSTGRGRGVLIVPGNGTFIMYGGSITGNTLINSDAGAGVYVPQEATFEMYGGEITDNTISGTSALGNPLGAGVYTAGYTTIIGSAKITGNKITAPSGKGGGIYAANNTLTLGGNAGIRNNEVQSQGGGIFADGNSRLNISGNVQVTDNKDAYFNTTGGSNLYLSYNSNSGLPRISVTGELGSASIGVTVGDQTSLTGKLPLTIATVDSVTTAYNWIKDSSFSSDNTLYKVTAANNGTTAVLNVHDTHTWRVQKKQGEDSVLTEYCDCGTYGGTLTVAMTGGQYTGEPYTPTLTYSNDWHSEKNPTIAYGKKMTDGTDRYMDTAAAIAWGDYKVSVQIGKTAVIEKTFTIAPLGRLTASDFTVTMPQNAVYDENTTWTASATAKEDSVANAIGIITVQYYNDDGLITDASGDPVTSVKDAGTYEVYLDIAAGDGYAEQKGIVDYEKWTFTVAKAERQVTVDIGERCSYGSAPSPKMTGLTFGETPTYTYAKRGSTDFTATVPTELGDYTVKATCETANIIYTGEANFSIVPLNAGSDGITLTWATGADRLTYNGSEQTPDLTKLTVNIALPGYAQNQLTNGTDYDITCESKTNKGAYDLTVTLKGNYSGSSTAAWYIDPLTAVLEWQNVTDRFYGDGLTVTATVKNVCAGDTVTVTVTGGDEAEVGSNYTATATGLSNDNYALPTDVMQTYSIEKAPGSVTAPTGKPGLRYAGQAQELLETAATSTTGTVEYKLGENGNWSTATPTATYAGEYMIYYRSTGDSNHNATDGAANITVTIGRKQIAIPQASSTEFFYNGSEQTYDVSETAAYSVSNNKRTNAGSQTVTYELTDKANTEWEDGSDTSQKLTFTIKRQYIGLDVKLSAYEFEYDGNTKEPSVTVTILGTAAALDASEYQVIHSTITRAGTASVTIKDTGSGNYSFSETYVNFTIKQKELTLPSASVSTKAYDGTTTATVNPGALIGVVDGDSGDVSVAEASVSGIFNDQYVGTGKNVTLSQSFTLTGSKAGNYTLAQPTVTGSITVSDQTPTITPAASVPRGGKQLDLNDLVSDAQGNVHFAISEGDEYAVLNGSMLKTKSDVGTVKITVTIDEADLNGDGQPECNAYTCTDAITVSVTLKTVPTITVPAAAANLVYNSSAQTLISAGSAEGGELQYRLDGGAYSTELPAATDAGDYTVYYKAFGDNDHEDSVEQSFTVTVQKATVTITAKNKSAYVGDTAPDLSTPAADKDYTVEGLFGSDTLGGTLALTYDPVPDMTKVGETVIKASGADAGANYTIAYVDGKLTISTRPSSGGGGGSGTVTPPTTTETETTTDPDGTTTKTETKSDGSTVETVTKPDGSTSITETKTETKPDGSTTTTETKSETKADGSKTETKSEATTAADGSKTETKSESKTEADGTKSETETKTETKPDGMTTTTETKSEAKADGSTTETKSETTAAVDGSKTETKSETKTEADGTKSETKSETKTDANGVTSGTETTKTTTPNGSTGTTTTTTENGNSKTEAETEISEKAVEDAKRSNEAVKVPTEVKAGENSDSAPTVKVELPKDVGETKIEIPVSDVNSGTVAVIVHEDGTEEIVKSSTTTENGLQLKIDGSATIKVIDNSWDFIDTRGHWSREEVNYVVARELFNGIGNNLFGVGQPMTRGMVNTVLARFAGVDTTPKNGQKWYEPGTEWAKANGITDGSNPEARVTREQLAAMLYRFSGTPEVSGSLLFNDAHEISGYAENSLLWAVQNGILNGVGDNRVAPKNNAERAQVAAMMSRYLKNVG